LAVGGEPRKIAPPAIVDRPDVARGISVPVARALTATNSITSSLDGAPRKEGRAMPRYFFNTRIGDDIIPDVEGEELRDPDHAWEVAKAMIEDLLEDEGDNPNLLTAALVVTDQKGEIVLEFPFSEALVARQEATTTRH
jgi:hypothetical protein